MLIHPSKPRGEKNRLPAPVISGPMKRYDDPFSRLGQGRESAHESVDARFCWENMSGADDDSIHCLPSALVVDITAAAIEGKARSEAYEEMLSQNSNFILVNADNGVSNYFKCLKGVAATRKYSPDMSVSCKPAPQFEKNAAEEKHWRHVAECRGARVVNERRKAGKSSTVMATWHEYAKVGKITRERVRSATVPLHVIDTISGAHEATVPKAVSRIMPSVKAVFILDPPWEYAISEWLRKCRVMCAHPREACTVKRFENALSRKEASATDVVRSGDYSRYLERWLEDFPPDRVIVYLPEIRTTACAAVRLGEFIHGVRRDIIRNGEESNKPLMWKSKFEMLSSATQKKLVCYYAKRMNALGRLLNEWGIEVVGNPRWYSRPESLCRDEKKQCDALSDSGWLNHLHKSWSALRNVTSVKDRLASKQCTDY